MSHARERHTALAAVRHAAVLCQAVQRDLVTAQAVRKRDKSPVTVADFASQAVVCAMLADAFPDDAVVGEESADALRAAPGETASAVGSSTRSVREAVVARVGAALDGIVSDVSDQRVLAWIDRGSADPASQRLNRFWTLDPIDGTKGFLRGEQYAIALALIEDGQVVLGVLGCPNLPPSAPPETASAVGSSNPPSPGTLLLATLGQGTRQLPLTGDDTDGPTIHVSDTADPAHARFCESVESGHSDQDASVLIARRLGITAQPVRMDSQAKYAAVARGDAEVYLRLPTRPGYEERIWDHAAGVLCVTEAGGRVCDVDGQTLDFTRGRTLAANRGVIATNAALHERVVEAVRGQS